MTLDDSPDRRQADSGGLELLRPQSVKRAKELGGVICLESYSIVARGLVHDRPVRGNPFDGFDEGLDVNGFPDVAVGSALIRLNDVILMRRRREHDYRNPFRAIVRTYEVNFDGFAQTIREVLRYWLIVNRPPPKPPD